MAAPTIYPYTDDDLLDDDLLRTVPYPAYLQSAHWGQVRMYALDNADHRCQVCNSPERLQVHHRTYERRAGEVPGDLTVLCAKCHQLFHEHGRLHKGATWT